MSRFGTNVQNMPTGRLFRVGVVALLAPAGVLCGHGLTYLLAIPDPVRRAAVLAETVHEWWASAVPIGAVLAVGAIFWVLAGGLRLDVGSAPQRKDVAAWLAPRLALCQLALFAVVEAAERIVTGHPVSGLLNHELIEHGVLAQVVVALALTAACWCLMLTVELACAVIDLPRMRPRARSMPAIGPGRGRPQRRLCCPLGARAPPLAC